MEGLLGSSSWLYIIFIGLIVGVLARFLKPGNDGMGFIMTILLGIGGAILASLIGQQMAAAAGVRFAWGRIFYLYGDDEDPRRLVPALIHALRAGQAFDATAGEQVRDYLHVRDVASGLITLAKTDAEGIYNIASGHPVSIREFMEIIVILLILIEVVMGFITFGRH